jgi:EpsI family protein
MTSRRDLLMGVTCLAGAGAAYALTPRRHVSLFGARKLQSLVPEQVPGWSSRDVTDLIAPATEGSLSAKLYGEVVQRVYVQDATGLEVMMLLARGDEQSNELQLHRPEVCYPAFGFRIVESRPIEIPIAADVLLPARRLVAEAPARVEHIIYWTRLGEYLPVSGAEQRLDRLKTAMAGYIADGLLARFSILGSDADADMASLEGFIQRLIKAVPLPGRSAFVGTRLAQTMAFAKG